MKIRIEANRVSYKSRVYLDDVDISSIVQSVDFRVAINEVTTATLVLVPHGVELAGEVVDLTMLARAGNHIDIDMNVLRRWKMERAEKVDAEPESD